MDILIVKILLNKETITNSSPAELIHNLIAFAFIVDARRDFFQN